MRARYTDSSITVYQAYSAEIADAALAAGTFVSPFKRARMTWIKPSFLWMAYRCGWATKPNQERVLAVEIKRTGIEWALEHACLSHYEAETYRDQAEWSERKRISPVRVQWDPERDLHHRPLDYRSIQIGLGGESVDHYVDDWILALSDVTPTMHDIAELVASGDLDNARALLPSEVSYPLSERLAETVGAT